MRSLLPIAALLALAACESRPTAVLGEHNVLVVAETGLWKQIEDSVLATLQPRPPQIPRESTFQFEHRPPTSAAPDLRRYRQIVLIGDPADPLVVEALGADQVPSEVPTVVQNDEPWARGQRVTVLAVSSDAAPAAVLDQIPRVAGLLERDYQSWIRQRMYVGGVDSGAAGELAGQQFVLPLPRAYRGGMVADSVLRFVSHQSDLDRLVRSLLVTWRTWDPERADTAGGSPSDSILAWRRTLAEDAYEWAQTLPSSQMEVHPLTTGSAQGTELRGVWNGTVDGFPHAGPFITRVIECPEQGREYLLDAWFFAPERAKYRYLVQMDVLLDSFGCPGASEMGGGGGRPET